MAKKIKVAVTDYIENDLNWEQDQLAKAGVDVDALAARLQDEGAKSFVESWGDLMSRIDSKSVAARRAG